jgi:predicted transcriptional regulator
MARSHPHTPSAAPRPATPPDPESAVRTMRERLDLTQPEFGRLVGVSTRTVASLEDPDFHPRDELRRRVLEILRLCNALGEVMKPTAVGRWLVTPNPALDGLKPVELAERGEIDRLWSMVYQLRSGNPA